MDKRHELETGDDIELTGEDNQVEPELVDVEERSNDKITTLRAKLTECESQKATHLEELQRAKAEFLNSRKRLEDQQRINEERARDEFVRSLLPLCDSFDMALKDKELWESVNENWRKGVEGIRAQLTNILKQHNVTEVNASGEHFDPNVHEAVGTTEGGGESGSIIEVAQKGYERNGSILRPAKVIIQN